MAVAKGPLHAIRGTNEQERMLKNAKTEYFNEHEEIATYRAIEEFASQVGDRETAKVARGIRREEERMANFLERLIPQLTKAVVRESVPRDQRDGGRSRRRTSARSTSRARTSGTRRRSSSRS
jgi:rubrerythrin